MKFAGLRVTFACLIGCTQLGISDDLNAILSTNKSMIFDYQMKTNELESDKLSKSWVNPVMLSYNKSYSTQFTTGTYDMSNFSVSIDQPIFRSGGIYFAIKYAQALRGANSSQIVLQKRQMVAEATTILFNIKKNRLLQEKIRYQLKNDAIDIKQKRESFDAGVLDSSFLDQAILKNSQDETSLLELELGLQALYQQFSLLSDKDPDSLRLPTLKLITKQTYTASNLELQRDRQKAQEKDYYEKVTWAKYLPTVSLHGTYMNGDLNPLYSGASALLKEKYYNYGFSISMPIDVNAFSDIEAGKVAKLQAAVEAIDRKETVEEEYVWIENNLAILDKKIALAQKDEKVYQSLYTVTKNLVKAGEKTELDAQVMQNALRIRKLDQKIYDIDRQIELLKIYARVENVL